VRVLSWEGYHEFGICHNQTKILFRARDAKRQRFLKQLSCGEFKPIEDLVSFDAPTRFLYLANVGDGFGPNRDDIEAYFASPVRSGRLSTCSTMKSSVVS